MSYDIAQILLDNFFLHADRCSQLDSSHFLRARFAHAETIIPFAALLRIPRVSDVSTPPSETYTYENNDWRGEFVSPMAANVQWEILRHHSHGRVRHARHQQILVRMLYNEYPVAFKAACRSYSSAHPYFYTIEELKRCYSLADR